MIEMHRKKIYMDVSSPGDFMWASIAGQKDIILAVPSKNEIGFAIARLPVTTEAASDGVWHWDGDEERPTLSPSVHTLGHWHGWVRNGQMVEA